MKAVCIFDNDISYFNGIGEHKGVIADIGGRGIHETETLQESAVSLFTNHTHCFFIWVDKSGFTCPSYDLFEPDGSADKLFLSGKRVRGNQKWLFGVSLLCFRQRISILGEEPHRRICLNEID